MKTERLNTEEISIRRAVGYLQAADPVAFPTETVYGLGAPVFSETCIKKIFLIKRRPADNPLIAHIAAVEDVHRLAMEIPPAFYRLAEAFFPGPLTIVLKRHPSVPAIVSAGHDTIAVRMPAHPVAQRLIDAIGEPLVAPSANLSGRPSPTTAQHVLDDLEGKLTAVIDGGPCAIGLESTVISLVHGELPVLLRPGTITPEQIEQVLKQPVVMSTEHAPIVSPGMKYRHYAPEAIVRLFESWDKLNEHITQHPEKRCCVLKGVSAVDLYKNLRTADAERYDEVLVFCDEETRGDLALMNRLLKASEGGMSNQMKGAERLL